MKRLLFFLCLAALPVASCSELDRGVVDARVKTLEDRAQAFAGQLVQLDRDIQALSSLMNAYAAGSHITAVEDISATHGRPAWKISFDKREPLIICDGRNGRNGHIGVDGTPGKDGHSPLVGVREIDGRWYWTVDGDLLKDAQGHNVPASSDPSESQATDGYTPVITIEDGRWVVTVNGLKTVLTDVSATEGIVEDGLFSAVNVSAGEVEFVLKDGTRFCLPRLGSFVFSLARVSDREVSYTVNGASGDVRVDVLGDGRWQVSVTPSATGGAIRLTAPDPMTNVTFLVLASDGAFSSTATFVINDGILNL
ncbi:MAG: hypothetical protein IJU13_07310 [Bacteroidales bacterium]|nr:hypothetical protein [Bacteroidales bacterium]